MTVNETIHSWWPLITRYSNPFSIILSGIVAMMCAGITMLVLLIVLRRLVLVKRRHIALRILSIAYFVVLPVLAGLFGFKWGLIRGLRNDLSGHAAVYLKPVDDAFRQKMMGSAPFANAAILSTNDAIDLMTDQLWKSYRGELLAQAGHDGAAGYIAGFLMRVSDGRFLATTVKSKLKDVVRDKIGVDREVTAEVLGTQWGVLLNEGVFTKIATLEIAVLANKMMKSVCVFFALILIMPTVEIGVSRHFARRALAQQGLLPNVR